METQERIEKLLEYLNIGPKVLAEQVGLKDSRIMDIRRGKVQSIAYPVADAISGKFHQISRDWLLTGEGEMLVNTDDILENIKSEDKGLQLMREELQMMREELALMRQQLAIIQSK